MKYVLCTLLGPEGPGLLTFGLVGLPSGSWSHPHEMPVLRVVWVGEDTARTLRTTQWTRASTRSYQIGQDLWFCLTWCVSCYVYQ